MLKHLPTYSDIDCQSQQQNGGIELRSRTAKNGLSSRYDNDSPTFTNGAYQYGNRVIVEHKLKPGETLNNIALQYSVQVAEIKRANGIVADQEIFALSIVRVPVSRLQREILLTQSIDTNNQQVLPHHPLATSPSSSSFQNGTFDLGMPTNTFSATSSFHNIQTNHLPAAVASANLMRSDNSSSYHRRSMTDSGKTPLLGNDCDSYSSDYESDFNNAKSKTKKSKKAIENLLEKMDATVAAVRENLSEKSPTLEGGAFHFIDAKAPDSGSSKGVWLILLSVIFMFVVVPLIFTLMEEQNEAELLHSHQHNTDVHSHHTSKILDHDSHEDISADLA